MQSIQQLEEFDKITGVLYESHLSLTQKKKEEAGILQKKLIAINKHHKDTNLNEIMRSSGFQSKIEEFLEEIEENEWKDIPVDENGVPKVIEKSIPVIGNIYSALGFVTNTASHILLAMQAAARIYKNVLGKEVEYGNKVIGDAFCASEEDFNKKYIRMFERNFIGGADLDDGNTISSKAQMLQLLSDVIYAYKYKEGANLSEGDKKAMLGATIQIIKLCDDIKEETIHKKTRKEFDNIKSELENQSSTFETEMDSENCIEYLIKEFGSIISKEEKKDPNGPQLCSLKRNLEKAKTLFSSIGSKLESVTDVHSIVQETTAVTISQ